MEEKDPKKVYRVESLIGIISKPGRTRIPGSSLEPKSRFQPSGTNQNRCHPIYSVEFKNIYIFLHMYQQEVHIHITHCNIFAGVMV